MSSSTSSKQLKKRPASPEADQEDTSLVNADGNGAIFISAPIHDRQSTFVAHFHPGPGVFAKQSGTAPGSGFGSGSKPLSLTATVKRLQSHPAFASASHRIVAWRRRSSQQTLFTTSTPTPTYTSSALGSGGSVATAKTTAAAAPAAIGGGGGGKVIYATGSEDDGEKYAGKRLERLLCDLDVEGVVVVARWYGGVLLGPVRFAHIENVAREAVRKWRESVGALSFSGDATGPKRQRLLDPEGAVVGASGVTAAAAAADGDGGDVERDAALRSRLAEQLTERDRSIVVLRGLLADKTKATSSTTGDEKISEASQTQQPQSSQSPASAKKIDYNEMPLARLKQLEKARDATIAFILRQLDKLEEEEKQKEKEKEG